MLTSQTQKEEYFKNKYTALYNTDYPISHNPDKINEIKKFSKHVPPLGDADSRDIGPITLDEVHMAIKKSSKNKCPGIDGIPSEFYQLFFPTIGPFLTRLFNNIYDGGTVPSSWNTTIIKLIPKKINLISFDTMRPLQLMAEIAKIYARIFYNRLDPLMRKLINPYQSGGVSGRNLNASVFLINLLLTYYNIIEDDGFMFCTDNRKAFDLIYRAYLFIVCRHYNLPSKMIDTFENIYSNNRAKLLINGYLTESFPINNGVRQGCPLSAALYVLAVEPLARYFQQCTYVQCMKLPNAFEVRFFQHIDDITFFLQNEISIRHTLTIIEKFNNVCGSKLNLKKCAILRTNHEGPEYNVEGIKVLSQESTHRVLGVEFCSFSTCKKGKVSSVKVMWEAISKSIKEKIQNWGPEDISLLGRTLLANLKLFSQINYISSILGIPQKYLEDINNRIYSFVDKQRTKIPGEVLTLSKDNGGVGLIDMAAKARALRVSYIQRLFKQSPITPEPVPNEIKMLSISDSINTILLYFLGFHMKKII